jgi:hypothetical protein
VYGVKGGIGRSTALALWAWHLAEQGRRILVVDLDLESPGVGTTLLSETHMPTFGVLDWLVEDAVGQADDALVRDLHARTPLDQGLEGEIRVVPACGRAGALVPKLSRAYVGMLGREGPEGFAERIARMLDVLEERLRPDVVLLDSRAGLHDIAAVALTRLSVRTALLFAADTAQTFAAYRALFEHWRGQEAVVRRVLERVKFVAAMLPEQGANETLLRIRERAFSLLVDTAYDEASGGEPARYELVDEDAPHDPLPIYWNRAFVDFDPVAQPGRIDLMQRAIAFGGFLAGASRLLDEGDR